MTIKRAFAAIFKQADWKFVSRKYMPNCCQLSIALFQKLL